MVDPLPHRPRKGRGAVTNPAGRYERLSAVAVDDGWGTVEDDLPPLRTTVTREAARTALSWNASPDIPFDRSVNPYRGCEHGCVYCYARPSHARSGLSSGLDFETRLFARTDIAEALERDLRKKAYRPAPVMVGAMTDAYQSVEREFRLTRAVFEVLEAYAHPALTVTKSALVLRDLDLLAAMAARRLVRVGISVTTLDDGLAGRLEPRAARPGKRLAAIRALREAGVPVGVLVSPMIPGLNDHELEAILEAARDAGAASASVSLLRLPHELGALFGEWLETHCPDRAERVLNGLRDHRAGNLDTPDFAHRLKGAGGRARLLDARFRLACKRLGLKDTCAGDFGLDMTAFRPPPRPGDQLALF